MRARVRAFVLPGLAVVMSGCGSSSPPTAVGARLRIVAGATATDTVDAVLRDGLAVDVVDESGKPARNTIVRFAAPLVAPPPYCVLCGGGQYAARVAPLGSGTFDSFTAVATDARGRAAVQVQLGPVVGSTRIVITVPDLGLRDSVIYQVRPGEVARVAILPRDTVLYRDSPATFRIAVTDRPGNPRSEVPTLVTSPTLTAEGARVTAREFGVHRLTGQFSGAKSDTATVRVVPHGTIAAVSVNSVITVDLDGSNYRSMTIGQGINSLAWFPDGTRLIVGMGRSEPSRLYEVRFDATPTQVFGSTTLVDQRSPWFSADGRWLYMIASRLRADPQIWRMRADGTGLEQVTVGALVQGPIGPSPDGAIIAFGGTCCQQIRTVGASSQAVTDLGVVGDAARWSPAGDLIAFAATDGMGVVSPMGGNVRKLTPFTGFADHSIDWSPDGRWIIYRTSAGLSIIDAYAGTTIPLPFVRDVQMATWKP